MRARTLKRILEALGFRWETATGGGSHFKIKRDGQRTVPLSLHNGLNEELSDLLLKKLAKQLGVPLEAFGLKSALPAGSRQAPPSLGPETGRYAQSGRSESPDDRE